jgi:hypothetical protein
VRSFVNSSSTVIAAALNCEEGSVNGSTRRVSPVLTRRSLRCTPLSAMVPFSTSSWGLQKSTRSPSSAYGTNAASAALTNAAFVSARSWLGQFATRSIAIVRAGATSAPARNARTNRKSARGTRDRFVHFSTCCSVRRTPAGPGARISVLDAANHVAR